MLLRFNEVSAPLTRLHRRDGFPVLVSDRGLGRNLPQRMGRRLWGPMLVMALMAFPVAVVLAVVRASLIASGDAAATTLIALEHATAGVTFIGFLAVLSAVSFAIARILGEFRAGGGLVQEAAGAKVQTLRMPGTAKAMLLFMMMGMMLILVPVVLHFVVASTVVGPSEPALTIAEQWFVALEGIRRLGVGACLLGIAFGLATIIRVLRFQSTRIGELALERRGENS